MPPRRTATGTGEIVRQRYPVDERGGLGGRHRRLGGRGADRRHARGGGSRSKRLPPTGKAHLPGRAGRGKGRPGPRPAGRGAAASGRRSGRCGATHPRARSDAAAASPHSLSSGTASAPDSSAARSRGSCPGPVTRLPGCLHAEGRDRAEARAGTLVRPCDIPAGQSGRPRARERAAGARSGRGRHRALAEASEPGQAVGNDVPRRKSNKRGEQFEPFGMRRPWN